MSLEGRSVEGFVVVLSLGEEALEGEEEVGGEGFGGGGGEGGRQFELRARRGEERSKVSLSGLRQRERWRKMSRTRGLLGWVRDALPWREEEASRTASPS